MPKDSTQSQDSTQQFQPNGSDSGSVTDSGGNVADSGSVGNTPDNPDNGNGAQLQALLNTASEAIARGFTPIPIRACEKRPHISAWPHLRWSGTDAQAQVQAVESFTKWYGEGAANLGLLLGAPSSGLVDVDLDHPQAIRLRDYFLPPTHMCTGRVGNPFSHRWYLADPLPATRRFVMPDGRVSVELRSTGSQTLIPPSIHPGKSRDAYRWEGLEWGGSEGPLRIDGRKLSVQVALLGLGAVLLDNWPEQGSRHDAYLALAGGLLRYGTNVHPWWERNFAVLIGALALITHDEDGPESRVAEVMRTTTDRLRNGKKTAGFPKLAELIGPEAAELTRRIARDVESLAGFTVENLTRDREQLAQRAAEQAQVLRQAASARAGGTEQGSETAELGGAVGNTGEGEEIEIEDEIIVSSLPPEKRNPLSERIGSWQPVDLEPYLAGEVEAPCPEILRRDDGKGLFYPGRVNSLFGRSESAKSWIALIACMQEMTLGARVLYIDFEDEPVLTLDRLKMLGVGNEDISMLFHYIHPEDPISTMHRNRWGETVSSESSRLNLQLFKTELESHDPSLIIIDGMTVLYGLHGLNTNDASSTDVITSWLKSLTRDGLTTVIVIDHTGKTPERGSTPIGAHHKIAMVQGSSLQVHPIVQPMPGELGRVELLVHKDRPGEVRRNSTRASIAVAAIVTLDSREPGITRVTVAAPEIEPPTNGNGGSGGSDGTHTSAGASTHGGNGTDSELSGSDIEISADVMGRISRRLEQDAMREARRNAVLSVLRASLGANPEGLSRRELEQALTARLARVASVRDSATDSESQRQATLAALEGPQSWVKSALEGLCKAGVVKVTGSARWTRYVIVPRGTA